MLLDGYTRSLEDDFYGVYICTTIHIQSKQFQPNSTILQLITNKLYRIVFFN